MNNFYDLICWKKSKELIIEIYKITRNFPKEEVFGITNQLKRASLSISANIAEGFGRISFKDKVRFYYNSRGSIFEVENFLILSFDLGYIDENNFIKIINILNEVKKLLQGLINASKTRF